MYSLYGFRVQRYEKGHCGSRGKVKYLHNSLALVLYAYHENLRTRIRIGGLYTSRGSIYWRYDPLHPRQRLMRGNIR